MIALLAARTAVPSACVSCEAAPAVVAAATRTAHRRLAPGCRAIAKPRAPRSGALVRAADATGRGAIAARLALDLALHWPTEGPAPALSAMAVADQLVLGVPGEERPRAPLAGRCAGRCGEMGVARP